MIVQMWCGIPLQMPECIVCQFPPVDYDSFPDDCCGAGHGLGELLVPDYILHIKVAPACWIHDLEWEIAEPSWDIFHASNSRLYANIKAIIEWRLTRPGVMRRHALRFPAIYAQAVDTVGRRIFWQLKKEQGHQIPASAAWLLRDRGDNKEKD